MYAINTIPDWHIHSMDMQYEHGTVNNINNNQKKKGISLGHMSKSLCMWRQQKTIWCWAIAIPITRRNDDLQASNVYTSSYIA